MKHPHMPAWFRSVLLSDPFWRLLPTPAIVYLNGALVTTPAEVPAMPETKWSQRERRALLTRSEDRLRNIEGKGPGLAAVTAVVAAAVLLALTGWGESELPARVLLVLATLYLALSLCTPLYLVGPLTRNTLTVEDLKDAVDDRRPDELLAKKSAAHAAKNDLQNIRLANHLDAARRELSYSLALVIMWALLVPVTGLLGAERAASKPSALWTHVPGLRLPWSSGLDSGGQ
jgi:hypothetical protein